MFSTAHFSHSCAAAVSVFMFMLCCTVLSWSVFKWAESRNAFSKVCIILAIASGDSFLAFKLRIFLTVRFFSSLALLPFILFHQLCVLCTHTLCSFVVSTLAISGNLPSSLCSMNTEMVQCAFWKVYMCIFQFRTEFPLYDYLFGKMGLTDIMPVIPVPPPKTHLHTYTRTNTTFPIQCKTFLSLSLFHAFDLGPSFPPILFLFSSIQSDSQKHRHTFHSVEQYEASEEKSVRQTFNSTFTIQTAL